MVQMPHPHWKPTDPQPHPFPTDVYIEYDTARETKSSAYPLAISVITPRPIALISSCNKEGQFNLAPYSYFNCVGHDPFTLVIGINRSGTRGGGKKDTLANIEETGEFVINIMSEWFVEAANHACGDFDSSVDELALAGLTPIASKRVKPPRVKESAVHMECKLVQVIDTPNAAGQPALAIVIAECVMLHVHEGVAGRSPSGSLVVDPIRMRPVCRLGGTMYGRVNELYNIGRPNSKQAHVGPADYTPPF